MQKLKPDELSMHKERIPMSTGVSMSECLIDKGVVSGSLNREIAMAILDKDYGLRDRLSKYFCSDCIEKHSLCYRFRKIIQDEAQNRWVIYRFSSSHSYDFDFYLRYDCKSPEKNSKFYIEKELTKDGKSSEKMEISNVTKEVMNVIKDLRADNQLIKSVNLHEFSKDSDIATSLIDKKNYRRTIQAPTNIDFKDLEKKTKEDILHTIIEESLPELLNQPTTKVVMQCSATFENLGEFGIDNKDVENLSASEIQKLKCGLAKKSKLKTDSIIIASIKPGSVNINYNVIQPTDPMQVKIRLRDSPNFMYAKLHEILTCDAFELQDFDPRGDKEFTTASSFEIGPKGKKRTYTQPKGYHRYGLKVLDKYENDYWLHPFKDNRNWYRAFHGTANAHKMGDHIGNREEISRDAMSSIYHDGFQIAKKNWYGDGVYSSPSINFLEKRGFIGKLGKFSFALQVCVDPKNCKIATKDIYVAHTPAAIRPYGIIIK